MWSLVRKENSLLVATALGFVGFESFQHTRRPVGDRKMPGLYGHQHGRHGHVTFPLRNVLTTQG